MKELPDQLLVTSALQGDSACFGLLCKRYYASIESIAYAVLMDRHLAEDAAQETLARACRSLSSLQKPEKVAGWLAAICRNIAKDMLVNQSQQRGLRQIEVPGVSSEPDSSEQDHLHRAIGQLPVSLREVVVMRYFDEMSYRQMGQILGLSEQAINGRLRRAKKKIETFLIKQGFGSDVS